MREQVGGKLAVWHASRQDDGPIGDPPTGNDPDERLDPSKRFASYGRWVEANVRAALVDANLTNEAKYAFLKAECEIDGENLVLAPQGERHDRQWRVVRDLREQRSQWVEVVLHNRHDNDPELSDRRGAAGSISGAGNRL